MTTQFKHIALGLSALVLASCASLNIKEGISSYQNYEMDDAISLLEKGLDKKDSPEGRRSLADAYAQTNQFDLAAEQYELLALSVVLTDDDRIAHGKALMASERYDDAENIFSGILSRDPSNEMAQMLKSSCNKIQEYKQDSSLYEVAPLNIGGTEIAYAPVIFKEGLLFTGERSNAGPKDAYTGLNYTDLFYAPGSGSDFASAEQIEGINQKFHDGIATVSADGNTMILTRSNYKRKNVLDANSAEESTTQLYVSEKMEDGTWSVPESMSINDPNYMFAHPNISPDGNTLYFSSNKAGGFGGMDLWKVEKIESGEWGTPMNLGAMINSKGDEVFPNLKSADSLYFSSDAQQTLGGLDLLFSAQRNGSWSTPEHLAYPLNTARDDFGMIFKDGQSGYLSSDRSGKDQLYSFIIFEPTVVMNGVVTKKGSANPLSDATITIINKTDGTEEIIKSDEVGMFEMPLLTGKDYEVKVEKEGYFSTIEVFNTKNIQSNKTMEQNFALLPLSNDDYDVTDNGSGNGNNDGNQNGNGDGSGNQDGSDNNNGNNNNGSNDGNGNADGINVNKPYEIPNINWDYNRWDIRSDAEPYLNYVVKLLKDNPELRIEISSHCDSRGSNAFNDVLSEKRANEVVKYLVAKGVKRSMLVSKGYGKRRLLNRCKTGVECSEAEHAANRRTEFQVVQ